MEPIKWNDEKIEQLLKSMPPIRDRQSKQELYLKIQTNIRYKQNKGKRIPSWGLPAIATACALVLFGVFVPDLMKPGFKMENAKFDNSDSGGMESKGTFKSSEDDKSDSGVTLKADKMTPVAYHSPLLAKDFTVSNKDWVTVAYMDDQAQLVIPVSFITNKAHYVDKVNEQLGKFKPEAAGLVESPLNRAKISEEEETVIIDFPPGVIYESEESLLQSLISYTYANKSQKSKVEFRTNGQQGYEFSLLGRKNEMDLKVPNTPYFRYDSPTTDVFIVSLFSAGKTDLPKDLKSAIEIMDDEQERGLKPLLPKGIELEIKITGEDFVEVTFPDSFRLSAEDTEDLMMIDAILLTAESYGYDRVKFNNTGIDSIGPYQLEEPIEDVTGINFYHYQ